jgi:hypothetical protein
MVILLFPTAAPKSAAVKSSSGAPSEIKLLHAIFFHAPPQIIIIKMYFGISSDPQYFYCAQATGSNACKT